MYKVLECSNSGVVKYACSKESDIDLLPKRGITIGSMAKLITLGGMRLFVFRQEDENTDGMWVEM